MQRLVLFVTSWPFVVLVCAAAAIFLVWPDEAYDVLRRIGRGGILFLYFFG